MKTLAGLICAAVLMAGCAATSGPDSPPTSLEDSINLTGVRALDAFNDPIRRVHIMTQTSRLASIGGTAIACAALVPFPFNIGVCPIVAVVADYIGYEYMLEPISKKRVEEGKSSLIGPYWETGPHADLGEFFDCGVGGVVDTHTCKVKHPQGP